MPTSESLKCYSVHDSNIPLRTKNQRGSLKRPKGLSKFPELSSYIETIVNGEEDHKPLDGDGCCGVSKDSMSKKNNKRSENKNKHEILKKVDSGTNHYTIKTKTKKNVTEYQNREASRKIRRSVQTVGSSSDGSKVDIVYAGKCLENLYPNPYDLERMERPKIRPKSDEGNTKSSRLSDLFEITHEIITKAKNIVIPELEISQNVLQAKKPRSAKASPDSENCVLSISLKGEVLGSNSKNDGPALIENTSFDSVKSEMKNKGKVLSNSSSSRESDRKERRYHVNIKRKHRTGNSKKPKDGTLDDIDLKKIKFITSSYYNDSIKKNGESQRKKKSDKFCFSAAENSCKLKFLKKSQDCVNLSQPQGLLKRAQEKLLAASKEEKLSKSVSYACDTEDQRYINFLREIRLSKTFAEKEEQTRNFKFPSGRPPGCVVIEEVGNKKFSETRPVHKKSETEEGGQFERKNKKMEATDEYSSFLGSEEFWKGFEKRSPFMDYDKLFETSRKIDDVLQFMYNCLQKFKHEHKPKISEETQSPEKSVPEDKTVQKSSASIIDAPTTSSSLKENSIESYCHVQRSVEKIHHIQSAPLVQERLVHDSSSLTGETSGFGSGPKSQSRRTQVGSELTSRSVHGIGENVYRTIITQRETVGGYPERPILCESVEVQPEPEIQTVEVQNELGGYSEEARAVIVEDPKLSRAILPHSVKFRNWKNDACEVIKNALETEEKLLASCGSSKQPSESKLSGWQTVKPSLDLLSSDEILMTSYVPGSGSAYSLIGGVDQQCPCFVIYVNSLPSILIPEVSSPLSIAFNETKALDLRPYTVSKSSLTTFCIDHHSDQKVSTYYYRFKKEFLKILSKSSVAQVSGLLCLKFKIPKLQVLGNLECLISFRVSPPRVLPEEPSCMQYSFQKEETNSEVLRLRDSHEPENSNEEEETEEESEVNSPETPMRDLEEAVEETEEKVLHLQEQKELGGDEAEEGKLSDLVKGKGSSVLAAEKKKVQDLLLRTYTLQNILHRYLHKMTCLRASSSSCPLVHHETFLDLEVLFREKTFAEILEEVETPSRHCHFVVYWPSESSETQGKVLDLRASDLPSRGEKPQQKETAERDEGPNDRFPVCRRKTSSDILDDRENSNEDLSKPSQEFQLLNKIFNELELSRRRHPRSTKSYPEEQNFEVRTENKIQESKLPTKVLQTLFKGEKDSSTKLKDDPLLERNVSAGRETFLPNHTQSRISTLKGKTKKISQESDFQINRGVYNKFSFFDLDSLRPTVSTCLSEHSKLGSDTINCGSEEEDDFKSVNSSLSSRSDTGEEDNQGAKDNEPKKVKTAPERISSKPPFDLYRRRTSSGEERTRLPPVCRSRELAPLQQALTEMQIRMRRINRDSITTNEYYRKALKLAKMSAGYCQNCGNHSVIPEDTFGFYRNLLPSSYCPHSQECFFRNAPRSSFYSFQTHSRDVSDHLLDINVNQSSYNMLSGSSRSARTYLKSSLHDQFFLG